MNTTMYYYQITFANDESIAIRSLIPNMTVNEAKVFIGKFNSKTLLEKFGEIIEAKSITREEVHCDFEDSYIDNWPIAVRFDILVKEYQKYQTQWLIEHGYTISDLIKELAKYNQEVEENIPVLTLYNDWLRDSGFGGEIWAFFDEWKECEGKLYHVIDREEV